MTWLIGLFTSRIGRLAAAIGAVLAAIGAVWVSGRRTGTKAAENRALRDSIEAGNEARKVQDDVNQASPDDVVRRLDGWMRDDNENL